MAAELFHLLTEADSAAARRRAAALGLVDRLEKRNVHFEEHRAAWAARGGRVTPALWDGERLHQGLDEVLAALERMAAGRGTVGAAQPQSSPRSRPALPVPSSPMAHFPAAPPRPLDPTGRALLGAYTGSFEVIDLAPMMGAGLRGWFARRAIRKRWIYLFAASEQALVGAAVVDLGYAGSAFAFALDRREGRQLFDLGLRGGPGSARVGDLPGDGARARFARGGRLVEIERCAERWRLLLEAGAWRADVTLTSAGGPAPFSLVAPVAPGRVNVTQKEGALAAGGWVASGARMLSLADGLGGADVTNGLLARRTAWRWAFAAGRDAANRALAFNLVSGFNAGAATEDVAFDADGPRPLPPCAFDFDPARPLEPWRVSSADAAVDLRFAPAALHREEVGAWLVRSRFVQVAGAFEGHLPGPDGRRAEVAGLPGVVEDQAVLW